MKSKNVKSLSYARGPKPPLFSGLPQCGKCPWLVSSFILDLSVSWGSFMETCRPLSGSCAESEVALGGSSCFSTHGRVDAFPYLRVFVSCQ